MHQVLSPCMKQDFVSDVKEVKSDQSSRQNSRGRQSHPRTQMSLTRRRVNNQIKTDFLFHRVRSLGKRLLIFQVLMYINLCHPRRKSKFDHRSNKIVQHLKQNEFIYSLPHLTSDFKTGTLKQEGLHFLVLRMWQILGVKKKLCDSNYYLLIRAKALKSIICFLLLLPLYHLTYNVITVTIGKLLIFFLGSTMISEVSVRDWLPHFCSLWPQNIMPGTCERTKLLT